jgi:hypothetical protein
VIDRLAGSKKARPGTLKTLRSWLGNFKPPFADAELDAMLQALQTRRRAHPPGQQDRLRSVSVSAAFTCQR